LIPDSRFSGRTIVAIIFHGLIGGRSIGGGLAATPLGYDFGQNAEGNFLGAIGADINSGRRVQSSELFLRYSSRLQTSDYLRDSLFVGHQRDI
jgi:hypothetical protein